VTATVVVVVVAEALAAELVLLVRCSRVTGLVQVAVNLLLNFLSSLLVTNLSTVVNVSALSVVNNFTQVYKIPTVLSVGILIYSYEAAERVSSRFFPYTTLWASIIVVILS
jgi:hypothetical protein